MLDSTVQVNIKIETGTFRLNSWSAKLSEKALWLFESGKDGAIGGAFALRVCVQIRAKTDIVCIKCYIYARQTGVNITGTLVICPVLQ